MSSNYLKSVRRLKLWVIILAIFNITIVSTIGVNMYLAKQREAQSKRSIEGVNTFFVKYLSLSGNQVEVFDSIVNDYSLSLKEVGMRLRSVKERFNTAGADNDTVVLNKIYEDFIMAQSLNRDLTMKFYENIRGICTPEQVRKFNEVISKTSITLGTQSTPQPDNN
ncbi:MAG: hypothetical protein CVU13_10940 [Bacteroidetes bacterium HGW-Bacteroidetes-8]|jgi:hypothetical protein|nr:MAG: hypothetical protein CVU13_10940 [Bacteroidetes bacterium HGW-Bacteroidetes-8]